MKVVLCQCSQILGDFKFNQQKIQSIARQYKNSDLVIFPEMMLMGYPPEDALENSLWIKKQQDILKKISADHSSLLLGAAYLEKGRLFNSAVCIYKNKTQVFHKSFLALSDTFDEMRFFSQGSIKKKILSIRGKKILILICEDLWKIKNIPAQKNIDLIVCMNASPFFPEQIENRLKFSKMACQKFKAPLAYLNQVGSQDEWIFDGSSFVLNKHGEKVIQFPCFSEKTQTIDLDQIHQKPSLKQSKKFSKINLQKEAIQTGIRDFVFKSGFKKVHLGLSGGIDSALVALLCKEALGSKNVKSLFIKGPHTPDQSQKLALEFSKEFKISLIEKEITSIYKQIISSFKKISSVAKQNIQARLRCLLLMTYSNTHSSLLIGTSNKSELAMGYATLYGDLTGALLPIGDLYKTQIQEMMKLYSSSKIIKKILKRPPSAELSPGQKDEDDLPLYRQLDPILKNIIEYQKPAKTSLEKDIFSRVLKNEFKRRQSPLVLKVSLKSFGRGRRYPINLSQEGYNL